VLSDERSDTRVVLAPQRGALVTSFSVAGRELLFLDSATLNDGSKNVRGGIPVLFPSPGKLEGDAWRTAGHAGHLKQHGFARQLAWAAEETQANGAAAVTLSLDSSPLTLAQFPWAFHAELTLTLEGPRLRYVARVRNDSAEAMPFALGYHPYFLTTDKPQARIDTRATRAFDNVTRQTVPFNGFDLSQPELDLHLLDHGSAASTLHFGDGSRLSLSGSAEFTHWVVWAVAGKDYVCLEPWTAPGNALNTGDRISRLAPGEQTQLSLAFEWHPASY
jgi:galactose mutarotase-like enzyme